MTKITNIAHPLKYRTGSSQGARYVETLASQYAPIDGKTLSDQLSLISQYAKVVGYYDLQKDQANKEYLQVDNWTGFFKNSLPFQLTCFSKFSTTDLKNRFLLLKTTLQENPSAFTLEALLAFIYNEIICSALDLYAAVTQADNSYNTSLLTILKSSYEKPLKDYIRLYNAAVTFFCISKIKFDRFSQDPWQIEAYDIYALDPCIQQVKKGKTAGYLLAGEIANGIFDQLLSGLREIIDTSPNYIQESLIPLEASLQQKHEPHLALMFTFLELFKHVQGNLNELSQKHLDFFYNNVLKLQPKNAVPDRAHVIFEIAKHLEEGYLLPEGLLLKDGKDTNKQDIQFRLDHDLIIDKTKITNLRSLSLYQVKASESKSCIEGAYIAPVANSLDGNGKKFKEKLANWATLGDKYSKVFLDGEIQPEEHPKARLGFVLASPVLLLQEGKREVTVTLNCNLLPEEPPLSELEKNEKIDEIAVKLNIIGVKDLYLLSDYFIEECNKTLAEEDKLSLTAEQYISKLLINQDPYELNQDDLPEFLNATDPISCLPIFTPNDKEQLTHCLNSLEFASKNIDDPLFKVSFSGEKGWIVANPVIHIIKNPVAGAVPLADFQFTLDITLDRDKPAVVFYNEENLKEKLDLKDPFPLVKIELNQDLRIPCENEDSEDEDCCLKKESSTSGNLSISPYDFLQNLVLVDAEINVTVCGVKDLIVQNDENLQDVNKPIMPFGPRPKVGEGWKLDKGANFYIGSKEIFCKNWQKLWINTTWKDKPDDFHEHYRNYRGDDFENGDAVITDCSFRFVASVLNQGNWANDAYNVDQPPPPILIDPGSGDNHWDDKYECDYLAEEYLALFKDSDEVEGVPEEPNPCGVLDPGDTFSHKLKESYFPEYDYLVKSMPEVNLEPLSIYTRKGFIRLTLAGTSFQHDRYTYVLARQMMALANLLDPESIELVKNDLDLLKKLSAEAITKMAAILREINFVINHVNSLNDTLIPGILSLAQTIAGHLSFINTNYDSNPAGSKARVTQALTAISDLVDDIGTAGDSSTTLGHLDHANGDLGQIKDFIEDNPGGDPNGISDDNVNNDLNSYGLEIILIDLERRIIRVANTLDVSNVGGIPKEPYTPLIKSLSIDYQAVAKIDDIELVHLYPYGNTSKHESIEEKPRLLPYFNDEGTLFIGLENLAPGGNLSLLFQLAEATADSELNRAKVNWHYLSNNSWMQLLPDFDVLSDATDGLTVTGIVNIAMPDDINKTGHTIMPDEMYWIKVSAPSNVKAVAETIGIHPQAALASAHFNALNDLQRLDIPLTAGSITKPVDSDFNVKKVEQLYDSFGGRQPEVSGHYYVRVSEHLKHKGRGIVVTDYEKIILEAFPEIYKVKCISHSMGLSANEYRRDLEVAPGYLIIAVIPDLAKLKPGNTKAPKAPISLLEKIGDHIRRITSPFARIKVMNPRYEPIDVTIEVRLYRGKSSRFYINTLKEEISHFLAPWFLGDSEKLAFGQKVVFSDLIGFVEQRDYVDYILNIELKGKCNQNGSVIKPLTARSILTGGKICVLINEEECIKEKM